MTAGPACHPCVLAGLEMLELCGSGSRVRPGTETPSKSVGEWAMAPSGVGPGAGNRTMTALFDVACLFHCAWRGQSDKGQLPAETVVLLASLTAVNPTIDGHGCNDWHVAHALARLERNHFGRPPHDHSQSRALLSDHRGLRSRRSKGSYVGLCQDGTVTRRSDKFDLVPESLTQVCGGRQCSRSVGTNLRLERP